MVTEFSPNDCNQGEIRSLVECLASLLSKGRSSAVAMLAILLRKASSSRETIRFDIAANAEA